MMNKVFRMILFAVLLVGALLWFPSLVYAQTAGTSLLDAQILIQQLQEQIRNLQKQVVELRSQIETSNKEVVTTKEEVKIAREEIRAVREELRLTRPLSRGSSGDEVRRLQEYLSQFPDIYPEGLVTGFYGSLTEAAVRKLQEKHGIEQLGIVGPKTLAKLNELITEGAEESGVIPPGLLHAPGIEQRLGATTTPHEIFSTTTPLFLAPSTTLALLPDSLPQTPNVPPRATSTTATTTPSEIISEAPATSATPVVSNVSASTPTPTSVSTPTQTSTPVSTSVSALTSTSTSTSTPVATSTSVSTPALPALRITWPNGGETLQYNLNYAVQYIATNVSRVGANLFKGSGVVWSAISPTVLDTQLSMGLSGINHFATVGSGNDYKVRIYDWDNPTSVYDMSDNYFSISPADILRPVVSNVSASSITPNSAVITWTTDEPATGFVNYGFTLTNWKVTPTDTSYTTSHSFTLTNLSAGTFYTYRVYSVDPSGNGPEGLPPNYTFITPPIGSTGTPTATTSLIFENTLASLSVVLQSLGALLQYIQQ